MPPFTECRGKIQTLKETQVSFSLFIALGTANNVKLQKRKAVKLFKNSSSFTSRDN